MIAKSESRPIHTKIAKLSWNWGEQHDMHEFDLPKSIKSFEAAVEKLDKICDGTWKPDRSAPGDGVTWRRYKADDADIYFVFITYLKPIRRKDNTL